MKEFHSRYFRFSKANNELKMMQNNASKNNLEEFIEWVKLSRKKIIKKAILDLGTKFARLQVAEISEVCTIQDTHLIKDTINEMIKNKEIYAQYFSSTESVAFNQQANIDEIDKLMEIYKDWEEKGKSKK